MLLNEARSKENETQKKTNSTPKQELPSTKIWLPDTPHKLPEDLSSPLQTNVKLKGVQLPMFSGEDKSELEAWKAVFTSVVDDSVMPVKKKMLRFLGCLRCKARETVKDLGFSSSAYERAKETLERKYGGKRRQTPNQLSTLRALPKVKRHNLEDLENLLTILDRILVALREDDPDGELKSNHSSLAVKEKLPEDYVREITNIGCWNRQSSIALKFLLNGLKLEYRLWRKLEKRPVTTRKETTKDKMAECYTEDLTRLARYERA